MSLPMPAKMRIKREIALLSKDPPPGIALALAIPNNPNTTNTDGEMNLSNFHATIRGPESSPFASGIFLLSIHVIAIIAAFWLIINGSLHYKEAVD